VTTEVRVAVVGSANLDVFVEVARLPERGETVLGRDATFRPGGKGANQAVAAHRFGANVGLLAAVGSDQFGQQISTGLREAGMSTAFMRVRDDRASGIALIVVDANSDNTITVAAGANGTLDAADVREFESFLRSCDALLLQLEVPTASALAAAEIALQAGVLVVLNAAPLSDHRNPDLQALIRIADVLIVNETEAMLLHPEGTDWGERASGMRNLGPSIAIITLGADGAVAASADGVIRQPALPVQAIDSTGAGDTFCGVLAAALGGGEPLAEAMGLACAAGALATTQVGAQEAMPTREAVVRFRSDVEVPHA